MYDRDCIPNLTSTEWPWIRHATFLSVSFLICDMGTIPSTSQVWTHVCQQCVCDTVSAQGRQLWSQNFGAPVTLETTASNSLIFQRRRRRPKASLLGVAPKASWSPALCLFYCSTYTSQKGLVSLLRILACSCKVFSFRKRTIKIPSRWDENLNK